MRRTLTVAGKEFRHMAHDRFALALILCLPVVQLLVYGYALDTRIRHVPAALVNRDANPWAGLLAQRISRSSVFRVVPGSYSVPEIEGALRTGAIRVAIEIPADYTSNLVLRKPTGIRVWLDGADVATSNYLLAALNTLGFEQLKEQLQRESGHWPSGSAIEIQPKILFNSSGRTADFLIPGLIAILVQTITTLLVAFSFATERERGTLEQMLVTPLGANAIIAGKVLAVAAVSFAECGCLVLLMQWLFSIPVQGSPWLLLAVLPLLVLAPIGLGLLIAAKARTQTQALQLANIVLLPSILLSGFVFPREFLKPPVDWISNLVPSSYLVSLTRNIVLRGTSLPEAAPDFLTAAAFGAVLIVLGVFSLRRSLQER